MGAPTTLCSGVEVCWNGSQNLGVTWWFAIKATARGQPGGRGRHGAGWGLRVRAPHPSAWEPAASRGSLELGLLQPLSARRERMPSSCVLGPGETGVRRMHTSGVRVNTETAQRPAKPNALGPGKKWVPVPFPWRWWPAWGWVAGEGRGELKVPALQSHGLPGDQPVLRLSRGVPAQPLVSANTGMT